MPLYHVTSEKRLTKILRDGLIPRREKRGQGFEDTPKGVYLFKSLAEAEDGVMNWLSDEFPEEEVLVLLEVQMPEGATLSDDPELTRSCVVCYDPIPPENIQIISRNL